MSNLKHVKKTLGGWFLVHWYPILFGAYPVLALLAFNAGQVKVEAAWRPLLICVGLAVLLYFFVEIDPA